jgi:uncharacterized membrane protein
MDRVGWLLQLVGLVLSFLGSVLMAASQGTVRPDGVFLFQKSPRKLKWGVRVLACGFFLQGLGFILIGPGSPSR